MSDLSYPKCLSVPRPYIKTRILFSDGQQRRRVRLETVHRLKEQDWQNFGESGFVELDGVTKDYDEGLEIPIRVGGGVKLDTLG
jgi:hypothetical protein